MSTNSSIEWTDCTWNPVAGCTIVSAGCTNCYAMKMAARLEAMGQAKYAGLTKKVNRLAVWTGKINCDERALLEPLKWKKPRRVFVNSMSDLFHEGVPFEFIDKVFAVMALSPSHTFQILTKRPERMAEYLSDYRSIMGVKTDENVWKLAACMDGKRFTQVYRPRLNDVGHWPLPNVWLGTSCENQKAADERIPHLLRCPAAVRFLSCEPLLGKLDLHGVNNRDSALIGSHSCINEGVWGGNRGPKLGWVIVGGESGPGARPCNVEWISGIVGQCKVAGVPAFVKQLGAKPFQPPRGDDTTGYELMIDDRKGGTPDEWPADLRIRQFPERRL